MSARARTGNAAKNILDGIRIVDFTHMVAGPLSTMILADMGADVIKVEPPDGETSRHLGDVVFGDQTDYFLSLNRNKRSIVLDLKSEEGLQAAKALIATSDIVVENFLSSKAEKMGLGYKAMASQNPALIYCSVNGFGTKSRFRDKPALDPIIQALSGLMNLTGTPETGPLKTGFLIGDFVPPLFATIGLLAALYERQISGKGQFLDVAMLDSLVFTMIPRETRFLANGIPPRLVGNGHNQLAPANTYYTSDARQIVVFCHTPKYWHMLARMLDREDLMEDVRFVSNAARVANKAVLDEILEAEFLRKPLSHWLGLIDRDGVTAGPVRTLEEVFGDEEVQQNMLASVSRSGVGHAKVLRTPIGFGRTPLQIHSAPPMLGEHTEEILMELKARRLLPHDERSRSKEDDDE
ncbi:MAG: CoA transferase [Anaerolineae bacterium]|nr:CoA transferase [Anaerolineae bacterium]